MRLTILRHYCKLDFKTINAASGIQAVEENEVIFDHAIQNWSKWFKDGDLSLEMNSRSGQPLVMN